MGKNYMPYQKKIYDLHDLCDLYQKYAIDQGKIFMKNQIGHQIGLVCSELSLDFQKLKGKTISGKLTHADYIKALSKYKLCIDSLVGLDHIKLGSAEILNELNNQIA